MNNFQTRKRFFETLIYKISADENFTLEEKLKIAKWMIYIEMKNAINESPKCQEIHVVMEKGPGIVPEKKKDNNE